MYVDACLRGEGAEEAFLDAYAQCLAGYTLTYSCCGYTLSDISGKRDWFL